VNRVSANGERRPPRPKIELLTEPASDSEAAAIVSALEQFLAETAPAPSAQNQPVSRWQRAGLVEGVSARDLAGRSWGRV
jgi:hypothetical protein